MTTPVTPKVTSLNGCPLREVSINYRSQCGPLIAVAACGARWDVPQGVPFNQTTAYQEWMTHTCPTTGSTP